MAVGADGMSGEDTDDEDIQDSTTNQEKALVRVPVRWINPELMEMFHVVNTWKSFKQQELLAGGDLRGNKSLKRNHRDKPPAIGTVKRKLPRNWYEDTWFKSLPAGQQGKLNVMPYRPIPTPVRSNIALLMATYQVLRVASLSKARRDIIGRQWAGCWAGSGPLSGPRVAHFLF